MEQIQYLIPAAVITNSEGKILFLKKETARVDICIDKWELPGGTINFGETVEQALKRKIRDYIGVDVQIKNIIPYIHSYTTTGRLNGEEKEMQFHVLGIICSLDKNQQIKLTADRIKDYTYLSYEDYSNLPEDQRVPGDLEILKSFQNL